MSEETDKQNVSQSLRKVRQVEFGAALEAARNCASPNDVMKLIPYSGFIGAQASLVDGRARYWLDARVSNIGNPSLPAIHGGVIGGFLELSVLVELLFCLETSAFPKVIDFSLDYLRPARYQTLYAHCQILRQGKQVINAAATAWQDDIKTPVATARGHFLIH